MVKNNNGYAMVIVLIVVTVLFMLSGALTVMINGEISLSSSNIKRINAKYNAETGIEEGISVIKNNSNNTYNPNADYSNQPFSNNSWDQGEYKYYIYSPNISGNTTNYYKIESFGYYPATKNEKKITALITQGDPNQPFVYGNTKDIKPEFFKSVFVDPSLIPNLYEEMLSFYYSDEDGDGIGDSSDSNIIATLNPDGVDGDNTFDKENTDISVKKDYTIPSNNLFHYRGNLTYSGTGGGSTSIDYSDIETENEISPPVILVDGNLKFDSIREIRNVIYIVKGDILIEGTPAKSKIYQSFLYTLGDFKLVKDEDKTGSNTQEPEFTVKGQIISENNITFYANDTNSTASYYGVKWPIGFKFENDPLINMKFEIVEWSE